MKYGFDFVFAIGISSNISYVMGGFFMHLEKDELQTKCIEEVISHIGAKVADAVDLSKKAKEMLARSEALLIDVQQELEGLYIRIACCELVRKMHFIIKRTVRDGHP